MATPSYTLDSGHPTCMENLKPSLWGLAILLQALRELKVLINHYYSHLDACSYNFSLDFVLTH